MPASKSETHAKSQRGAGRWDCFTRRPSIAVIADKLSKQMPWRPIGRMDDDELAAIYEYLTHLPVGENCSVASEVSVAKKSACPATTTLF